MNRKKSSFVTQEALEARTYEIMNTIFDGENNLNDQLQIQIDTLQRDIDRLAKRISALENTRHESSIFKPNLLIT